MVYYINQFTGLVRKYQEGKGYNLMPDFSWQETKASEKLVKKLPYYKVREVQ
jgi:hypothetical protein